MQSPIRCGKCETVIPPSYYNLDHLAPCPKCLTDIQVQVFPAMYRAAGRSGPTLAEASDATCFFHPENRAVVPCASCGRFLCTVCETDLGGEVLCPSCIHTGVTTRKLVRLENRRILYDNIALSVSTVPMLMIWPTIFTAPMAIFLSVRYWRAPSSLLPRTKVRYVIAILLGLLQIVAWAFAGYAIAVTSGRIQ